VDTLYTWFLWVSAFSFASVGIHVWTVPTMFNELSPPNPKPTRLRQAIYSAVSFAGATFYIFYALTQYPDIHRSWVDVAVAGLLTFTFGFMALSGWIRLAMQTVRRMRHRGYTDPASASSK
jgi:hypothetical protein